MRQADDNFDFLNEEDTSVAKTQEKVTKASVIRQYLNDARHADLGPTDLADLINREQNLKVRPADVSAEKWKLNRSQSEGSASSPPPPSPQRTAASSTKPRVRRAPRLAAPSSSGVSDSLAQLKEVVETFGKEETKRLIDIVS